MEVIGSVGGRGNWFMWLGFVCLLMGYFFKLFFYRDGEIDFCLL